MTMEQEMCETTNVPVDTCVCPLHALEKGIREVPVDPIANFVRAPYDVICDVGGETIAEGDEVAYTSEKWICPTHIEEGL